MKVKSIECKVYLSKAACDRSGADHGIGYPAMLNGTSDLYVKLPGGSCIISHAHVEFINSLSVPVPISELAEFTTDSPLVVPLAGSIEAGEIIKGIKHGELVFVKLTGELRLLPLKFLKEVCSEPEVSTKDLYTYIADTTGVDRNSVKTFLFKTLLSNPKNDTPIFEIVRELKLSYQEVSHMIQSFNEWTGAYEKLN